MNIKDLDLKGKTVLIRVDFNVPFDAQGKISDDTRIQAALPTIQYVLDKGASIILMSHLGRPKGEKNPKFSLKPCAKRLSELLNKEVRMASDCIGDEVEDTASNLQPGELLLLENLRFHPAEERPDVNPQFAKDLAKLADVYINDAFGTAHRTHSSTATIAQYFPNHAAAGLLLQKEISFLGDNLKNPKHPFYAIIGGAKVSSKLGVLQSLLTKADALFIGGGMAYTFLKAQGHAIGNSLYEEDLLNEAKKILSKAKAQKTPIFLPLDVVIANEFANESEQKIAETTQGIPDGWEGMDIGPVTQKQWTNTLQNAQTVFWNGPLGVFEFPNFAKGTNHIAKVLAKLPATTIIGGGDSVAAINKLRLAKDFSHISTGGGASLEYIEYGHLPGIDALAEKS